MRRLPIVAVCVLGLTSACSDGTKREPPVFRVLSPVLFTFEGQDSAVSVEVDRRARFSVVDADGAPRGTALADQAGEFQVPFDPSGLSLEEPTTLRVVAVSDLGGRAESSVTIRHGSLGLEVLSGEIYDATLLTDGRIFIAGERGLLVQASPTSSDFGDPLDVEGGTRRVVAPGPDGEMFAAGDDNVILHYDTSGELCDRIELLPTQVSTGESDASAVVALATHFGDESIEVAAAHDLGFSGFNFTNLACATNGCGATVDDCEINPDPSSGFSTGTVLCLVDEESDADFRATAVAMDGARIYTGGYTLTIRDLGTKANVCADLGLRYGSDLLGDIAVSQASVWVAMAGGLSRMDRDFTDVAKPSTDRYGRGRAAADGLDVLPDFDLQTLTAVAPGDAGTDGVWFGTPTGLGRIVRTAESAEIAWISGRSLPGPNVRAILAPADDPELLWVATDEGLMRLFLPAEP